MVFNPPFVFGPPLIRSLPIGTSVDWFFDTVVRGTVKDASVLAQTICYVDVRDVAEAHMRSLSVPEAGGERVTLSAGAVVWQEASTSVPSSISASKAELHDFPSQQPPIDVQPPTSENTFY